MPGLLDSQANKLATITHPARSEHQQPNPTYLNTPPTSNMNHNSKTLNFAYPKANSQMIQPTHETSMHVSFKYDTSSYIKGGESGPRYSQL